MLTASRQICRIDSQLDRLQFRDTSAWHIEALEDGSSDSQSSDHRLYHRILHLQRLIKSISTTSSPNAPLLPTSKVLLTLSNAKLSTTCAKCEWQADTAVSEPEGVVLEHELEWLLLAKATTQVYGQILNTILDQTLALNDHIWYWEDILSSRRYATLYSLQTSPLRLHDWAQDLWQKSEHARRADALSHGWRAFWALVRRTSRARSLAHMHRNMMSPVARVRAQAQKKQEALRQLRELNANALGVLLGEGLGNADLLPEEMGFGADVSASQERAMVQRSWKTNVAKSVALMETVLAQVDEPDMDVEAFEERIGAATSSDAYFDLKRPISAVQRVELRPKEISERLAGVVLQTLPQFNAVFEQRVREYGRPSRVIRYWLPVTVGLLSSSTVLRILVNRKADIVTWIYEFGATCVDFWSNWVVEPIRKVIGTIRHDEGSEVAIMSKRSLEGDRSSLERMVVDFAIQNPENGSVTEADIADIRAKVREGDLTPVLKAYEKDLQKPFLGAVRGNLIRALLIQIQKTKVDVEVAMGGIDALLKSQELVFGFVGLTPGLLVTIAAVRWVNGTFVNRRGRKEGKKQGQMLGVLRLVLLYNSSVFNQLIKTCRNIDRILTNAQPSKDDALYYKDYGLLLTETHVLRQIANRVLPSQIYREFLIEVNELTDIKTGVARQKCVISRMRWGYSKWF